MITVSACDIPKNDYIPTQEKILNHYPSYLIDANEIIGLYGNNDVDAIVFSYKTNTKDFLKIINDKLTNEHWVQEKNDASELTMVRYNEPTVRYSTLNSLEVVKMSLINNLVCIGYVQLDTEDNVKASSGTVESIWDNNQFWPKYEQCKST